MRSVCKWIQSVDASVLEIAEADVIVSTNSTRAGTDEVRAYKLWLDII